MKRFAKILVCLALGWFAGAGSLWVFLEATREEATARPSPLPAMVPPIVAPEPPAPPPVVREPEPAPPPAPVPEPSPILPQAPAPEEERPEYFGFRVPRGAAPSPPPAPPAPLPVPRPPEPVRLRFVPVPSKCVAGFDGTSTLHDFRGWTQAVTGGVEFDEGRMDSTAAARFTVDARTLDTGNPDRDKEMHADHLQSAAYPDMKFTLTRFKPTDPPGSCSIAGTLEIHGKAKDAEFAGTFELRSDGYLHVKGETAAKMTDFGIAPPSTMLVINVADEMKIWFEVWARREETKK